MRSETFPRITALVFNENIDRVHAAPGRNNVHRFISLLAVTAAFVISTSAYAQQDFKIGVVESLTGGFAGPARDTMDGLDAWMKARGLPGKKVVLTTLDDETNGVSAANAFRRLAGDPDIHLIYLFIPSSSAMAVKTLASEFKVPIISGGAADALGTPADPYLFKVAPATRDFMTRLAQYIKQKKLQAPRHAGAERRLRPVGNRQHEEVRARIWFRAGRRRDARRRGYQLQRPAHPYPRCQPGCALRRRLGSRCDPDVQADQAAGPDDAADHGAVGCRQTVL
ncbi:MAG: ABC transporter substrate-binding protein [Xanthobacteraceae bacterium]|nr:ABC transporter substrate-binding protein [Xanthobacteraceae bacterium]